MAPLPLWHRRDRWLLGPVLLLVLLAAGLELIARFELGLGNPPLLNRDGTIEYLHAPNHAGTYRFKTYRYNQWHMRSDPLPARKANPHELRVLVIGDSIVNGLTIVDQSELVTEVAQRRLAAQTGRSVRVLNVAASSWGAQNQLAYIERFGTFDADAAVIVTSSHDAVDIAFWRPLSDTRRALDFERPVLPLTEYVGDWLTRRARRWGIASRPASELAGAYERSYRTTSAALKQLIERLQADGLPVTVIHHATRGELFTGYEDGYDVLAAAARDAGARWVEDRALMRLTRDAKVKPYADGIHLSARGHALVAVMIGDAVLASTDGTLSATSNAPTMEGP